ncbi:hypothetical protein H5410_028009 [Solanum commersonii]|uniref:Uncharacterized protein n=1 Tax=Solanum commersonii TaxID=4109 RepID=A0A9J5Z2T6_SOLCO|nr:hypothetical protein H5410_028009 [Solanum commersonii]
MAFVESQTIPVWDPLFIEAISKWKFAFTAESKYRFQLDSIYAVISETRGEASFEIGDRTILVDP